MASTELKRKTLFFIPFAGITTLILLLLPFIERAVQTYLLAAFGLVISDKGKVSNIDEKPVEMMTATSIELMVNAVHIIKIALWMMLVIAVVRYLGFLILKAANRKQSQSEIATLTKTVLSIIIYIV